LPAGSIALRIASISLGTKSLRIAFSARSPRTISARGYVMLAKTASSVLTNLGALSAKPLAFLTVVAYAALWIVFDRASLDWHGVATLATWMMTVFIQRSEHRDTQAVHAKLDELLRAHQEAQDNLARIDEKEPEEIEDYRKEKNEKQ